MLYIIKYFYISYYIFYLLGAGGAGKQGGLKVTNSADFNCLGHSQRDRRRAMTLTTEGRRHTVTVGGMDRQPVSQGHDLRSRSYCKTSDITGEVMVFYLFSGSAG